MSEKIALREVGMRDGLQSIATVMPTATKIAWLDAEYAAGVRHVEVSSFVPPKLLPQLADAEAVIAHALFAKADRWRMDYHRHIELGRQLKERQAFVVIGIMAGLAGEDPCAFQAVSFDGPFGNASSPCGTVPAMP